MRLSKHFLRSGLAVNGASAVAARLANGMREFGQRLNGLLRKRVGIELMRFYSRLESSAETASIRFPGVLEDPDVRFALDELGPSRIEAARVNLSACNERDYVSLIEFLVGAADGVSYDIDHAGDAAEVGDALVRGLDNLHDFLLAHELVEPAYRRAQAGPPLMFRAFRDSGPRPIWHPRRKTPRQRQAIERFSKDDTKHRVAVS